MAKYSFCHGWAINPNDFSEVTCKLREKCAYFDIDFYRHYGNRLDEFEELFPFAPCKYFILKKGCTIKEERKEDENPFDVDYGNT